MKPTNPKKPLLSFSQWQADPEAADSNSLGSELLDQARNLLENFPDRVKNAGTEEDERTIAALAHLLATRPNRFQGISDVWPTALLQRNHHYTRTSDNKTFISIGCNHDLALGWGVSQIDFQGEIYYKSQKFENEWDAIANLEFLTLFNLKRINGTGEEAFQATRTVLRHLHFSSSTTFCPNQQGL